MGLLSGTELQLSGRSPESVHRENQVLRQSLQFIKALTDGAIASGNALEAVESIKQAITLAETELHLPTRSPQHINSFSLGDK